MEEFGVFEFCSSVTSFKLPDNIPVIDEYYFWGCESLKEIDILPSVKRIGPSAFVNSGLKSIKLTDDDIILDEYCFGYTQDSGEYKTIPDFVIYGNPGSTAQSYATDNGIKFSCINHTPVVMSAVEATETSTGLKEGSKCSVCGEILKAQEVIPKLTHVLQCYSIKNC